MGLKNKQLIGVTFAVTSGVLFTIAAVTNRFVFLENNFEAYRYVASVLLVGGCFGFIDLVRRPKFVKQNLTKFGRLYLILIIGLLSTIAIGLMIYGQSLTTSTNTSIISTAVILSTAFFALIIAKEKPRPKSKVWLPVMFIGVIYNHGRFRKH